MDSFLRNYLPQVCEKWKWKLSNRRQLKITVSAPSMPQLNFVQLVLQSFLHKIFQMNVRSYSYSYD